MLNGVVGISGDSAWAVGSFSDNNFTSNTLAASWNGHTWGVINSPDVSTQVPTS